jgi:hypothetical protein
VERPYNAGCKLLVNYNLADSIGNGSDGMEQQGTGRISLIRHVIGEEASTINHLKMMSTGTSHCMGMVEDNSLTKVPATAGGSRLL